jgi:hypothetical protein
MRRSVVRDLALVRTAQELTKIDDLNELLHEALRALTGREAGRRLAALGGTSPGAARPNRRRQPVRRSL